MEIQATHKGNFSEDFGIDVECYVLNDATKTAVISQRGMGVALGLGEGGSRLPVFVKGEIISSYLGHELRQKLENPLIFQGLTSGTNAPPPPNVYGYDVTILIDLCKAIVQAWIDGKILKRQENIVKQAQTILNASAKLGIKWLVYSLAGYSATREEVISAFKLYVQEEAREYEKEFPDQLYNEWYRIYSLQRPERNHPWKFKTLTLEHIYFPLAKSNGKILELIQYKRESGSERSKKLHQFLSSVGVKTLRMHLGQILSIAQLASNQEEYEKNFRRIFGDQHELDL